MVLYSSGWCWVYTFSTPFEKPCEIYVKQEEWSPYLQTAEKLEPSRHDVLIAKEVACSFTFAAKRQQPIDKILKNAK
jgi:hypothetical protein